MIRVKEKVTQAVEKNHELILAINHQDWGVARRIVQNNNNLHRLIQIEDGCGRNPLHYACCTFATPPDILSAIVQHPSSRDEALSKRDSQGQIPLFYALQNASFSDEQIIEIIKASPQAACSVDDIGWNPLHVAIHFAKSSAVVRALLIAAPMNIHVASSEFVGMNTPFHMFFEEWNMGIRVALDALQQQNNHLVDGCDIRKMVVRHYNGQEQTMEEVNELASLLLQAEQQGIILEETPSLTPFEAIAAITSNHSCPFSFFDMMLKIEPELSQMHDEKGNYLLHIAATTTENIMDGDLYKCDGCESQITFYWYQNDEANGVWRYCPSCFGEIRDGGTDEGNFLVINSVDKLSSITKTLIQLHPELASIPNGEGRLPLHLSIETGMRSHGYCGATEIFQTQPTSLSTKDIKTKLFPFAIAALGTGVVNNIDQFSTCFALLMENPSLITRDT